MNKQYDIEIGKIYDSNGKSGKYEIVEDLGYGKLKGCYTTRRLVKVKFLNTGNERIVRYYDAIHGSIKDIGNIPKVGDIRDSNCNGEYKIIKDLGVILLEGYKYTQRAYLIEFITTGYQTVVCHSRILSGEIKDPYRPAVCGIGYIGEPDRSRADYNIAYARWHAMISRCYNINDVQYNEYGKIGVRVDSRWHCFANFLDDIKFLSNYNKFIKEPSNYELDKDILQRGVPKCNRIYSKDTCMFINTRVNSIQMAADRADKDNNKYIGVDYIKDRNEYHVCLNSTNHSIYKGRFKDPIVAANMYNQYVQRFNLNLPINLNLPYISPEEVYALNMSKREMCRILDKKKDSHG